MDALTPVIAALAITALIVLVICISLSNDVRRLKLQVTRSWSGIDVQLKRRYDLVPNLVETVKAAAAFEQGTLERLVKARSEIDRAAPGDMRARAEADLGRQMRGVMMRAEAYPVLKSSANFLELQRELADTEDRIAAARRFYNANVTAFNQRIETFPGSLFRGSLGPAPYFELDDPSERLMPKLGL